MKKILWLAGILVVVFVAIWIIKLNSAPDPTNPFNEANAAAKEWWETTNPTPPTPDEKWILDPEIPDNYIPVLNSDELYMVINEEGKIEKYRHRTKMEDGTWVWEDVDPNIPENYVAVEGLENVYMVEGADGSVRYFRYTRNDDDTYFFTEVDAEGNPIVNDTPVGDEIPPNYIRIEGTNVYAVYNEYGVLIGYKERVYNEATGQYEWINTEKPEKNNDYTYSLEDITTPTPQPGGDIYIIDGGRETVEDGYIEREQKTTTQQENGWTVVYETIITKKYDKNGNLVSTKKDGPTEVNRFPTTSVSTEILPSNEGYKENSLDNEYIRITNGLTYDTEKENELYATLTAQRVKDGIPVITPDTNGTIYKLARMKAADMAKNGTKTEASKLYGTIKTMCEYYGISGEIYENIWAAPAGKTAADIHLKFQANAASYAIRMNQNVTSAAISIISTNEGVFVVELYRP